MPLSTSDQTNDTASNIVKTLKGAFGTPAGFRPAHARGILLSGTFTPTSAAASLSKAPHFNNASTPVTVRFSNSTGIHQIPDNDPQANPHGMAVRFDLGSPGGRRAHTDIIAHSTAFFPVRTGALFLELLQAIGASSGPDAPSPPPIAKFIEANPSAGAFIGDPKPAPESFATEKYFGVTAFKFISADGKETFVRYRIKPEAGEKHLSDEEAKGRDSAYLHNEIQTRMIDGGASFKLFAQIAREGDTIDDATVHWPESREVVELGTIRLDSVMEDNDEKQRTIIFDPIPRVDGVEASDDPLLDMRASVYLQSGRERRAAKV